MPLVHQRNPWQYERMIHDPTLNFLYRKEYKNIKNRDFFNVDHTVIPMFIDPAKLYLYRYLKMEPYLHELFNINEEIHPLHPFHPTEAEVLKIINKCYFGIRNPLSFPLKKNKRRRRRGRNPLGDAEKLRAFLAAGDSESDPDLSPGEVTDWTSDDFETGSEQSINSWKYKPSQNDNKTKK